MKRKLLILLALLLIYVQSFCQIIPYDKQLHYAAGMMVGYPTAIFSYTYTENVSKTFLWTIGTTAFIAGTKEIVYDKWMERGTPEFKDFLWTMGGGLTGFGIVRLMVWNEPKLKKLQRTTYVSCSKNGLGIIIIF